MTRTRKASIGQRAVACKHWRWMAGMRAWSRSHGEARRLVGDGDTTVPHDAVPDFDDPATLGCLQALCEELHGFPLCAYICRAGGWLVESAHDHGKSLATDAVCRTRAEVWVHVLELSGTHKTSTTFRAGDVVRHHPTGEKWVLACDQDSDAVMPGGWPETRAQASDCTLLKAATDAERLDMLEMCSGEAASESASYRRSLARRQLEAERGGGT